MEGNKITKRIKKYAVGIGVVIGIIIAICTVIDIYQFFAYSKYYKYVNGTLSRSKERKINYSDISKSKINDRAEKYENSKKMLPILLIYLFVLNPLSVMCLYAYAEMVEDIHYIRNKNILGADSGE